MNLEKRSQIPKRVVSADVLKPPQSILQITNDVGEIVDRIAIQSFTRLRHGQWLGDSVIAKVRESSSNDLIHRMIVPRRRLKFVISRFAFRRGLNCKNEDVQGP